MHWIALHWPVDGAAGMPSPEALGWWALQFTPRVAWVDEALLLEVSACERLWGGRRALLQQISKRNPAETPVRCAQAATSLIAIALLRLKLSNRLSRVNSPAELLSNLPAGLPLDTLSAARGHLDLLARLGCRNWGDLAALPRGGLARRFGAALREALDMAWGTRPEKHHWLGLPDRFERKLELPALATGASELMWSAQRLLGELQLWLRARQCGVLAVELEWTHELRRVDGVDLPPTGSLVLRTAEPTQDMAHLRRLATEQLARTPLAAPASWLALRSLTTAPWAGASTSFLSEDHRPGERLHELVERLGARLGDAQVLMATPLADHRPECMQAWHAAREVESGAANGAAIGKASGAASGAAKAATAKPPRDAAKAQAAKAPRQPLPSDALYPPWLLREPVALAMRGERPYFRGVLRQRIGPQRLETGWWSAGHGARDAATQSASTSPALRDYYVAESPGAGLVWIYCERPLASRSPQSARWFLHGIYA